MNPLLDFRKCNIIIIGDIIFDEYFLGDVKRISPEAPVPVVHIKEKSNTLGGAGNVAFNLVSLGCKVSLFGQRGDDVSGNIISEILKINNVEDCLEIDPLKPTTRKTRVIAHGQQLIRLDEEEVGEISNDNSNILFHKFYERIENVDAVILSDYSKGVLVADLPQKIIQICREKKIPVFVDPKRVNWERYNGATCVTPNISEFEEISNIIIGSNEKLMVEVANIIKAKYSIENLVITRGADGMCLIEKDGSPRFSKATAHEVFDVSGAGDTVIATLTACIASGLSFPESTEIANIAAGIVVGKIGSQPINLEELKAEIHSNKFQEGSLCVGKSYSINAAEMKVKVWQAADEKIVFIEGEFVALDFKIVRYLIDAKRLGNKLIIGLTKENNVKNDLISQNMQNRIELLSALSCVDLIVPVDKGDSIYLINLLKPDIVIYENLNSISISQREAIEKYGGSLQILS